MEQEKLSPIPEQELGLDISNFENSRFSKYLSYNVTEFKNFSNESLALDITAYIFEICQKTYTDAWGYFEFDYVKFCKIFTYSTDYVFTHFKKSDCVEYIKGGKEVSLSKIPFIVQRNRDNINLDAIFDKSTKHNDSFSTTILGNVFYELRYRSFIDPKNNILRDKDGAVRELHLSDLNLIEEYVVFYHRNRRDRTIIKFKPNKLLLFNNFKAFFNINMNNFKDLKLPEKKLYIYISDKIGEIKYKHQNEISISVNEGCSIANIQRAEKKDNKKTLKNFLNSINQKLDESDRFILNPDKKLTPNSRHNYLLSLQFPNVKHLDNTQRNAILKATYDDYYKKALHEAYIKFHIANSKISNEEKLSFDKWLNSNLNIDQKISAYIEAQAIIFENDLKRDSFQVLKEFTPETSITPEELSSRLLADNRLEMFEKVYSIKTNYANVKPIPFNELNKDKFLCHSLDMFLKAYPTIKTIAYAKQEKVFFIVMKNDKFIGK